MGGIPPPLLSWSKPRGWISGVTPDRKIKVIICGTDIYILKAIFDDMKMFASAITIYNCNTHVEQWAFVFVLLQFRLRQTFSCYELLLSICVCVIWILDPCLWQDCPRKLVMETITLNLFNHYLYIAVSTHYVYIAIAVHSVQHIHLIFFSHRWWRNGHCSHQTFPKRIVVYYICIFHLNTKQDSY